MRLVEEWGESLEVWGTGGASDLVLGSVVLGCALVLDFGISVWDLRLGRCFVRCG